MPPNTSTPTPDPVDEHNDGFIKPKIGQGPDGQPASTYAGIWRYPSNRDDRLRSAEDWMECEFHTK